MNSKWPLKLTFVIASLSCGGAERVTANLANHWTAKGRQITLTTLDLKDNKWAGN